jgi:hypothetical protein
VKELQTSNILEAYLEQNRRTSNRVDLTGEKFGSLTVVEPSINIEGRTTWLCLCECGSKRVILTRELRRGKATSCGCKKKPKGLEQMHYIGGTCIEMISSTRIRSNNRSGQPGVFRDSNSNKWRAEIMFRGKRYYLGRFNDIKDAIASREDAKDRLHNNFIKEYKDTKENQKSN